MDTQRHIIKRQVLELRVAGKQDTQRLSTEFARVYRQRIVPLIDQYCTKLGDPNGIHRIESLEIDLGSVDPARFEADVLEKISVCLEPLLASRIEGDERQRRGCGGSFSWPVQNGQGRRAREQENPYGLHGGRPPRPVPWNSSISLLAQAACPGWWADSNQPDILVETLERLLRETPDRLRALLRRLARMDRPLQRIVNHYGDDQLSALFDLLAPQFARALPGLSWKLPRQIVDLLQGRGRNDQSRRRVRSRVWYQTLRFAGLSGSEHLEPAVFSRDLLLQVATGSWGDTAALVSDMHRAVQSGDVSVDRGLREAIETLYHESQAEHRNTETDLSASEEKSFRRRSENAREDGDSSTHAPDSGFSEDDQRYIDNAGLVILWPFLGHFFAHLGLMEQDRFKDDAALQRAVGLLQYLVTLDPSPSEYLLPLGKLLCGMEPDDLFDFGPPVSEAEVAECANLLQAVIAQAPILKDMSIPAFRDTFLLREGILRARDGAWLLRVERKTFDVVLDRFPWSTDWVKLPWIEMPLRVEW
uniref:Uncharacterized protein n=1 Tax=Candidatus Kentrum sp. LPFa TaxID=2126335 RepID=A0A450Y1Q3_9GAMM|nr:MAG: hypothetical protein BECKLPF1236A_GA0070988_1004417 [Candidatus Kentron sp. LPFa]VFK35471.1 MAG: hypothetical protein BECKLPF1236C_GA0070990_103792 [Candidatus Kentron sp. LPFa]